MANMINDSKVKEELLKIPAVDKIINSSQLQQYREKLDYQVLKTIVQETLSEFRNWLIKGKTEVNEKNIYESIETRIYFYFASPLKKVINCTGVILNTNLGRAPLGSLLLDEVYPIIEGYNNLEFDLGKGKRGSRNQHLKNVLRLLTRCEDSVVVNNNAAAVFLTLKTHCQGKEVIVSRGELVEIGGSFRIPDIISESGAEMVEVGTTNKTKLADYENAVTDQTAAILKVHKSNYYIGGFTEEVSVKDISLLAKKHNLLTIHDLGTGLPDVNLLPDKIDEPDIKTSMNDEVDLVTFSCDKLLGGPQAGIIAGKKDLIYEISKHPLMRILRVDKMILTTLYFSLKALLYNDKEIIKKVPLFQYLNRDEQKLSQTAEIMAAKIKSQLVTESQFKVSIVDNEGRCGGGTLPDYTIKSKAVLIQPQGCSDKKAKRFAENLYSRLLQGEVPIVAILREGKILFDVLTLTEKDINLVVKAIGDFLLVEPSILP